MTAPRQQDSRGIVRSAFGTPNQHRLEHPKSNTDRICMDVKRGFIRGNNHWSYRPSHTVKVVRAREHGRSEAQAAHQLRTLLADLKAELEDLKAEIAEEMR